MPPAPAAVAPEPQKLSLTPTPPTQQCRRPRSPLANGLAAGDFELRHWRTPKKRAAPQWAPPPVIEIPNGGAGSDGDDSNSSGGGGGHGYTSLRDILSSPEYAAAGGSPGACGGGGCGSCGDIHMIRHPLVKHAAYAYLQMTPSAREDPGRRGRRWRGSLCRMLLGCLSFIGALFRP
ncbi:hypothetical protein Zm00014a_024706 [Zea mays]|jgi:hypothetical protein|uniref:Uncharacterized protein n=2 Tax=Zea mays TaxID=4577 RepID=B6SLX4_MAIZE|nr:uncharacterized protein LOC100275251 [Zea mays]ACG25857.1 hypothetical protein [Zea mays]AQK39343.1 hypothetical protein ZEAMMB73_Zm00001d023461 [Zea mays]PWZ45522.1 hypothetical protein Zm00014a_024706 [Zea mays]